MKEILGKISWIVIFGLLGLFLYYYITSVISNLQFLGPCSNTDGVFGYLFCVFLMPVIGIWIIAISKIGPFLCILGFIIGGCGVLAALLGIIEDIFVETDEGLGIFTNLIMGATCYGVIYVSYTGFVDSWMYELIMEYLLNGK